MQTQTRRCAKRDHLPPRRVASLWRGTGAVSSIVKLRTLAVIVTLLALAYAIPVALAEDQARANQQRKTRMLPPAPRPSHCAQR